jgi:hypothetical protein
MINVPAINRIIRSDDMAIFLRFKIVPGGAVWPAIAASDGRAVPLDAAPSYIQSFN